MEDHKKNPKRYPILHTGLIRLIVEHFQNFPAPTIVDVPPESEEDDIEPSCSRNEPNLRLVREVLSPSSVQTGKKRQNPQSAKACTMSKPGSSTLIPKGAEKNLLVKNLVSYSEDS